MINASNFTNTVWLLSTDEYVFFFFERKSIFKMLLLLLLLMLLLIMRMMYRQASGIKISEQTNPPNQTKSETKAYSTVLCVLNKWS